MATVAEPIRALSRGNTQFYWSTECQSAFEKLKRMISENLRVSLYDPNAPTFLSTDASGVGISAVLSQIQDGSERIIACASHTLQPAERNYSTLEQEGLACVWGTEKFEKFLWGRPFTLRTDHRALEQLLQGPAKAEKNRRSSKLIRWAERLGAFDFIIQHVPGKDNSFADALSRLPLPSSTFALPELSRDTILKRVAADGITLTEIQNATKSDLVLQKVIGFVDKHWPGKNQITRELMPYYSVRQELYTENGYLVRDSQIVAPSSLHAQILQLGHL